MIDPRIWVVRPGQSGEAEHLFRTKSVVALAFDPVASLAQCQTRDDVRALVTVAHAGASFGRIANFTGQLFRFAHEAQIGDYVLTPWKTEPALAIGRFTSGYRYDQSELPEFAHRRDVAWLRLSEPRTRFSNGALAELNALMTFFEVRTYADEFRQVLATPSREEAAPDEPEDRSLRFTHTEPIQWTKRQVRPEALPVEDTPPLAVDVVESTRDFVRKSLARNFKGTPLESLFADLLRVMGYQTVGAPGGPDGGIDLRAHRTELGFEAPVLVIQVKSTGGSTGSPEVQQLVGCLRGGELGVFVSLGSYTSAAKSFAESRRDLRLVDGEAVIDLVLEHYERLNDHVRALIPLRRAWLPQYLGDEGQE